MCVESRPGSYLVHVDAHARWDNNETDVKVNVSLQLFLKRLRLFSQQAPLKIPGTNTTQYLASQQIFMET